MELFEVEVQCGLIMRSMNGEEQGYIWNLVTTDWTKLLSESSDYATMLPVSAFF